MSRDRIVSPVLLDSVSNYDLKRLISQDGRSKVYVVICKRGRLRGRELVLKETSQHSSLTNISTTAGLHKSLHHPSVLSLHSYFSDASDATFYQVLELCSQGTLSEYIQRRYEPSHASDGDAESISEPEIRTILKCLSEALAYLESEQVEHGRVTAANIFLNEVFRPKLGNFEHAHRILPSKDVQALGPLCLHLMGNGTSDSIPPTYSTELQDMVNQLKSQQITRAHDVLSLPFLAKSREVAPLKPMALTFQNKTADDPPTPHTFPSPTTPASISSQEPPKLRDIIRRASGQSERHIRVLSDTLNTPRPLRTKFHQPEKHALGSVTQSHLISPPATGRKAIDVQKPRLPLRKPSAPPSPPKTELRSSKTKRLRAQSEGSDASTTSSSSSTIHVSRRTIPPDPSKTPSTSSTSPKCLSVFPLQPQLFKTIHGHLTILASNDPLLHEPKLFFDDVPSRGNILLVDLREGERTRGEKGDDVFLVSTCGRYITAYTEPKLSLPCLLTTDRVIGRWTLGSLPRRYWRRYKFAAEYLELCKKRTPSLIIFTPQAKCTLFSNGPLADIEIIAPSPSPSSSSPTTTRSKAPHSIRTTISRANETITISRFTTTTTNPTRRTDSQWTKRTLALSILPQLDPTSEDSDSVADTRARTIDTEDSSKTFQEAELDLNAARTITLLDLQEQAAVLHAQKCRRLLEMIERSPEFADVGLNGGRTLDELPIQHALQLDDSIIAHPLDDGRRTKAKDLNFLNELQNEFPLSSPLAASDPLVFGNTSPSVDRASPTSTAITIALRSKIVPRPPRRSLSPPFAS